MFREYYEKLHIVALFMKISAFLAAFGLLYYLNRDVYAYATLPFMISCYRMLFSVYYVSYVALKVLEILRSRMQLAKTLKYVDLNLLT